jgi:hypothetical protein
MSRMGPRTRNHCIGEGQQQFNSQSVKGQQKFNSQSVKLVVNQSWLGGFELVVTWYPTSSELSMRVEEYPLSGGIA